MLVQLGMVPALHENLRAAKRNGLIDFFVDLVVSDDVGVVLFFRAPKCTELAVDIADVGVVNVAIDDVGNDVVARLTGIASDIGEVCPMSVAMCIRVVRCRQ